MSSITDGECPACHASMIGAEIPESDREAFGGATHFKRTIGVEYERGYDGISEWHCPDCDYREGRWTGNALTGNATEPKYGGR